MNSDEWCKDSNESDVESDVENSGDDGTGKGKGGHNIASTPTMACRPD